MTNSVTKKLLKIEKEILPVKKDRLSFDTIISDSRDISIVDEHQLKLIKLIICKQIKKYLLRANTWNNFKKSMLLSYTDYDLLFLRL